MFQRMWALTVSSRAVWLERCKLFLSLSLAVRACLAVSASPGLSVLVPRLASVVTLAVRADARDAISICIYPSTYNGPGSWGA